MGEYERGDFDDPFTLVSPTTADRFKLRARLLPNEGLTITGVVHTRRFENDDARTSLVAPFDLATDNFSGYLKYRRGRSSTYAGYTRQEWDSEIINRGTTLPGFQGGLQFDFPSIYRYEVNNVTGGLGWDFTDAVRAGLDLRFYDNSGTFALDWQQYLFFAEFRSPAGYLLRLSYQRNEYDEDAFDFDDYQSNIVAVSVGYRF